MPPSKEDILLTYLGKRDANRNLSNTPKLMKILYIKQQLKTTPIKLENGL